MEEVKIWKLSIFAVAKKMRFTVVDKFGDILNMIKYNFINIFYILF